MTSGMSGLREIRTSIESLPLVPEVQAPIMYNVVSVPSGYEIDGNGGFKPMPICIEHDPQPPLRLDERSMEANFEPQSEPPSTPTIETLKAELRAMGHDRLVELARVLDVGQ